MCLKTRGFERGDEEPVNREASRLKEDIAQMWRPEGMFWEWRGAQRSACGWINKAGKAGDPKLRCQGLVDNGEPEGSEGGGVMWRKSSYGKMKVALVDRMETGCRMGGRKAFGPETPILALSQRLTRVR